MKTYDELPDEQQAKARTVALATLLQDVLDGIRFSDRLNHDTLQANIDGAIERANDMGTPWFAHEYIMEAKYTSEYFDGGPMSVGEALEGMALCQAEDTLYSESTEHVVAGIAVATPAAAPARKEG